MAVFSSCASLLIGPSARNRIFFSDKILEKCTSTCQFAKMLSHRGSNSSQRATVASGWSHGKDFIGKKRFPTKITIFASTQFFFFFYYYFFFFFFYYYFFYSFSSTTTYFSSTSSTTTFSSTSSSSTTTSRKIKKPPFFGPHSSTIFRLRPSM
jgi:hypothetical protein